MFMEFSQLLKLGFMDYLRSFWNVVELVGHAATLVISPCVLCRYGVNEGGFILPLVSLNKGGFILPIASKRGLFHA